MRDSGTEYMDNDLDSVQVFSLLDVQFKKLNGSGLSEDERDEIFGLLNIIGKVFGVLNKDPRSVIDEIKYLELKKSGISRTEVDNLIKRRDELRARRMFSSADQIRDQLLKQGVTVSDDSGSTVWDPLFAVE